jgi:REP element-mobilizing transposase RayT
MHPAYRRSPRLPAASYLGPLAAHVIFVTNRRQALFADGELASLCLQALQESMLKYAASLVAYCIMPDHVHLLVEIPEGTSLQDWAKHAKQLLDSGSRKRLATSPGK